MVRISKTIWQANWLYLFLALLVQFYLMINQSKLYRDSYHVFGLRVDWTRFFWVVLASNFLSMVSPSGGFVAGIALVLSDGRKIKLSQGKTIISNVAYWVVYYSTFIFFLLISLFYLLLKESLTDYMLYPALILFAIVAVVLTIMFLALDNYDNFKNTSIKVVQKINSINERLGRNAKVSLKSIKRHSYEIYEGYHYAINNLWTLKNLIYRSTMMIFLNVAILSLLVKSFGGDWWAVGFLLSCYVVAALLMVVSVTPSGVGVVELAMVSILSSYVLDFDRAVMVVVLYRLYQFWIPLFLGFFAFRKIGGNIMVDK